VTVGSLTANLFNEYLLHGYDMARAVGREWSCPEPAADTTLAVMAPLILTLFNPESAADLTASFAIDSPRSRVCFEGLRAPRTSSTPTPPPTAPSPGLHLGCCCGSPDGPDGTTPD
jgi:hypothetical protein